MIFDIQFVPTSRRRKPPPEWVYNARRTWGGRLLVELNSIHKTPEWLGERVGYKVPSSMRQVINGHHGMTSQIYRRVCRVLPVMRQIFRPPMTDDRQRPGSPGPHRKHRYPKGKHFRLRVVKLKNGAS